MSERNFDTTTSTRIDKIDAAVRKGREALQRRDEEVRRHRRLRAMVLHLLISSVISLLTLLLLTLRFLNATYTHPAITAASIATAAAAATIGAIVLPNTINGDHEQPPQATSTIPQLPSPPVISVPPKSASPRPTKTRPGPPPRSASPVTAEATEPTKAPQAATGRLVKPPPMPSPPAVAPPIPGDRSVVPRCLVDVERPVVLRLLCRTT